MKLTLVVTLLFSIAALALTVYREFEDPMIIPVSANPVTKIETTDNEALNEELLKLKLRLTALEKEESI